MPQTNPIGSISGESPVEWILHSIWPQARPGSRREWKESPVFTSLGLSWKLKIRDLNSDYFSINLYRMSSPSGWQASIGPRNLFAILGVKWADGTLEEGPRLRDDGHRFLSIDVKKRHLQLFPSAALVVTCRFEVEEPTDPIKTETPFLNPSAVDIQETKLEELEDLSSDFKNLLNSERKYDVTINVQGKEFRVHRAVLSARSAVFRAMYEHETSEDKTGYLTIPDCDPESFGDFLSYIYSGKLDEISFSTAYNLYATAEKYDVQKLKSFCAGHMKRKMTMENVSDVIILADKFGDDALKSSCADYARRNLTVDSVCQAILLADRYGDDELMFSAREFFNKNFSKIFQTSEWKSMLRNHVRLVDTLLSGLDEAASKKP